MRLELKEREELEMHGEVVVAVLTCNGQENRSRHNHISFIHKKTTIKTSGLLSMFELRVMLPIKCGK